MIGSENTGLAVRARTPMPDGTGRDGEDMAPDRIRLLQFLTMFGVGGTERQVVNLARALDPSRFELHFGCFRRWGELLGEIAEYGIPITECRVTNLYNLIAWKERLRFARYLRRERIEVVHTYSFYANLFAIPAARLARVPVVVASVRDLGVELTPLRRRVQQLVCRLADRIAVNSEAVKQYLIADGHDPEKIVVIPNGIDLSRFPGRFSDGRIRHEFGLPRHAPLVAVFARLVPMKGVEHFLEAAALVAQRIPEARFLVVGDQWLVAQDGAIVRDVAYRNELQRHAEHLGLDGRVVFTGFRLDVAELLSEIAVSVLPSVKGEGLPNAVLEAMAAGVPVVATNVAGNVEAVDDGVTGFLVPPRDEHALARAICELLENPALAARFGAAGRERVVRHFPLERYARTTEDLYLDLLAGKGGRLWRAWITT